MASMPAPRMLWHVFSTSLISCLVSTGCAISLGIGLGSALHVLSLLTFTLCCWFCLLETCVCDQSSKWCREHGAVTLNDCLVDVLQVPGKSIVKAGVLEELHQYDVCPFMQA